MSLNEQGNGGPPSQHPTSSNQITTLQSPLEPIKRTQSTSFINAVEQSSTSLTDVDLKEVMNELNRPRQLDNSDISRITSKELSKPQLASIDEPDNFYISIKAYMDEKIDRGDTSITTTKMMNKINQFVDSRMSKILMTCFRHYNNEKLLEEQKSFMTPQEIELANKVIENIKTFREFIYH